VYCALLTTTVLLLTSAPDTCHFGVDPDPDPDADPAPAVIDFEDPNKKLVKKSFSAHYFI
jgi:hypothetical protein